jgi:hypothetical protein
MSADTTRPDWPGFRLDTTATLTTEQSRRLWCIAATVALYSGRGVPWSQILPIARWLYSGQDPNE